MSGFYRQVQPVKTNARGRSSVVGLRCAPSRGVMAAPKRRRDATLG